MQYIILPALQCCLIAIADLGYHCSSYRFDSYRAEGGDASSYFPIFFLFLLLGFCSTKARHNEHAADVTPQPASNLVLSQGLSYWFCWFYAFLAFLLLDFVAGLSRGGQGWGQQYTDFQQIGQMLWIVHIAQGTVFLLTPLYIYGTGAQ